MNIIVDDLLAHSQIQGEENKKTILFLHGWGSDISAFKDLMKAFSKSYRVVALDMPGFGGTDKPKSAWGVKEYAVFVKHFLDKANIQALHGVVAHSMGGRVSLYGMGNDIFEAEKLVLIGSHGIDQSKSLRNRSYKLLAKSGKLVTAALPKSVREKLRNKLYKSAGATDYLNAGEMRETFKRVINEDLRNAASNVEEQTLLIYGKDDTVTPVEFGKQFEAVMPHAKLKTVAGAGHYAFLDKPEEVTKMIREFMK